MNDSSVLIYRFGDTEMLTEKELFNNHLKHYISQNNTVVHETKHASKPLYIVHQYEPDESEPAYIKSGCVYLIYAKPEQDAAKPPQVHDLERPVMEYRLISRVNEEKYIELMTLKLDESFRGMGLGKILIKYFENKIVRKYYKDIRFVKGYILLGDRDLKIFFHKHGYMIRDNEFVKKMVAPGVDTKEVKESALYKYINSLLRQS